MTENRTTALASANGLDDARRRTLVRLANKIQRWADTASDHEMRAKLLDVAAELVLIAEQPEPKPKPDQAA